MNFLQSVDIQSFKTVFLSIVLEASPFLIAGVLVSSLLQAWLSEKLLRRIIPRNPLVGLLAVSLLGVLFPVCECGIVPVVRRLIKKGMPAYLGIAFMLATPVVNPVVYAATFAAFRTRPEMAFMRMGLAYAVAVLAGLFIYLLADGNPLKRRREDLAGDASAESKMTWSGRGEHLLNEFFDMSKYLLFGAFLAASLQVLVPRGVLVDIGSDSLLAYPFMMGLAFVMSLCSTSDAFVAASFSNVFAKGPLLAFMVLGPMLDFKSTLMLLSSFRTRFVLLLVVLLLVLVWLGSAVTGSL
ncbi:permease [Paenibacillus sp. YN15]|uniref:permease n=1 Tax=Paenibacillus sp. YN15 TaxID=1742774 RepID=UPI00215D0898|nr:permease [Paenibacillus sp. YN15]